MVFLYFFPPFLLGIFLVLIGVIFYFFPPKKINGVYGYKTASSMSSQKKWDLAQKYFSSNLIIIGVLLMATNFIAEQISFCKSHQKEFTFLVIALALISLIFFTEHKLKNND